MTLSSEQIRHIARLARIDLSEAELERTRAKLDEALRAHRAAVRLLGRRIPPERLGGNPQELVLDDILLRFPDVRDRLRLDELLPFWPACRICPVVRSMLICRSSFSTRSHLLSATTSPTPSSTT